MQQNWKTKRSKGRFALSSRGHHQKARPFCSRSNRRMPRRHGASMAALPFTMVTLRMTSGRVRTLQGELTLSASLDCEVAKNAGSPRLQVRYRCGTYRRAECRHTLPVQHRNKVKQTRNPSFAPINVSTFGPAIGAVALPRGGG